MKVLILSSLDSFLWQAEPILKPLPHPNPTPPHLSRTIPLLYKKGTIAQETLRISVSETRNKEQIFVFGIS
jgi:hypothetical protein